MQQKERNFYQQLDLLARSYQIREKSKPSPRDFPVNSRLKKSMRKIIRTRQADVRLPVAQMVLSELKFGRRKATDSKLMIGSVCDGIWDGMIGGSQHPGHKTMSKRGFILVTTQPFLKGTGRSGWPYRQRFRANGSRSLWRRTLIVRTMSE